MSMLYKMINDSIRNYNNTLEPFANKRINNITFKYS